MDSAVDDLCNARLIQDEVRDEISPDGVRAETGKEDAEEQAHGDLVALLLVSTMITSDLIEIGRFCSPKWSGG